MDLGFIYPLKGDATAEETGPSGANTGSYYYYFEGTSGSTGDTAVLETNVALASKQLELLLARFFVCFVCILHTQK